MEEERRFGDFEIDDNEIQGKAVERKMGEVLRVFFCGEQRAGADSAGGVLEFAEIASVVVMMVWEFAVIGDREIPVLEVLEEGARIADATEGVEGARGQLVAGQQLGLRLELAKAEKLCGRREDGIVLKFFDGGAGARDGFCASKDEEIGAGHGGEGLAKTASGEHGLLAEGLRGVDEEDVEVARELEVLEAVVEEEDIDGGLQLCALFVAIGADPEGNAILEAGFHQLDFIAGAGLAFIAAGKDGYALAIGEKTLGKPDDHGSFAGTADSEIADTDHRAGELLLLECSIGIEHGTPAGGGAVERRERPEEQPQEERQVHGLAPPNCLETSAIVRSREPRLDSMSCLAASPMRFIFSGCLRR